MLQTELLILTLDLSTEDDYNFAVSIITLCHVSGGMTPNYVHVFYLNKKERLALLVVAYQTRYLNEFEVSHISDYEKHIKSLVLYCR